MYGAVDFYRACKAEGIKPIIGCEVYVGAGGHGSTSSHEFDAESRGIWCCCARTRRATETYPTWCRRRFIEGFYIKPRIDMELLRQHAEGLIALSACLAGEIPRRLLNGDYDEARRHTHWRCADIFGRGSFYLELQDHGIPEQTEVNRGILRLPQRDGHARWCVPTTPTICGRRTPRATTCCCASRPARRVDDENRMRYEPRNFYLRSPTEEMAALFAGYRGRGGQHREDRRACASWSSPSASTICRNSSCRRGTTTYTICESCATRGLLERYGRHEPEYRKQLEYELDMIEKMGFTDYFLIVSDFVRYAKSAGIPVGPGRGSAAGIHGGLLPAASRTSTP